jgi:hypothetical protein
MIGSHVKEGHAEAPVQMLAKQLENVALRNVWMCREAPWNTPGEGPVLCKGEP